LPVEKGCVRPKSPMVIGDTPTGYPQAPGDIRQLGRLVVLEDLRLDAADSAGHLQHPARHAPWARADVVAAVVAEAAPLGGHGSAAVPGPLLVEAAAAPGRGRDQPAVAAQSGRGAGRAELPL